MKGEMMRAKNIYYPEGFQAKVDKLMSILDQLGVDVKNPKHDTLSESKLFRYLVEEKLKALGVSTEESKNL